MNNQIESPLQFTETAANKAKILIANEGNPDLKLRVYVTCGGCNGFQYGFIFDDHINNNDIIIEREGVLLIIDSTSLKYLTGSAVDYVEELEGSRFVVINPNAKNVCGCGLSFNI